MKKIAFTLLLMLVCVGAWAQYAQNGVLKRAGTHLEMDGERLAPEAQAALLADVGGIDYNAAWEEAGGPYITGGLIATAAGVAAMCIGIPKLVSSNRKLNGIVDSCNSARQPAQLTLGPAPSGFGLSLRF